MNRIARYARRYTTEGFTLVELMIVIAIIGILGAIALAVFTPQVDKAKCADVETAVHETMLEAVRWTAENNADPSSQTYQGLTGKSSLPGNVNNINISYNATTNSITVTGTPAAGLTCSTANTFILKESDAKGSW